MEEVVVSVICAAYNHERYIAQALDGFVMQKTNFKFEVLINDDASTDATAEIIKSYEKKYPDVIRAFYSEKNEYSQGISPTLKLYENANGKYIALCEGDDFWINENKLQIQVDYMESHPECTICGHSAYNCYENGVIKCNLFKSFDKDCVVSTEDVISRWIFPTQSILYRASARVPFIVPFKKDAPCGDYPLAVYLALKGSAFYFADAMSVYRNGSVSSVSKKWRNDDFKTVIFYEKFNQLLDRIDEYTDGAYSVCIKDHKLRCDCYIAVAMHKVKEILFGQKFKSISYKKKGYSIVTIIMKKLHIWKLSCYVFDSIKYKLALKNTKKIKQKNIIVLDRV